MSEEKLNDMGVIFLIKSFAPLLLHLNDWHTAMVPMVLGETNKVDPGFINWVRNRVGMPKKRIRKEIAQSMESLGTKTVLTIHNLMYQGDASEKLIKKTGLSKKLFHVYRGKYDDYIKVLREGLEYTDIVTTVSPTYAKEITTGGFGRHMDKVLAERSDRVVGILNGIDTKLWNPKEDTSLAFRFDERNAAVGKAKNRHALQKVLGFPDADVPIVGFIGRIEARHRNGHTQRQLHQRETETPL